MPAVTGQRLDLEMLVLAVLDQESAHGYAIARRLEERSQGTLRLGEGTLYPILHRLSASGLIEGSASEVEGRQRRTYRLTPRGRRRLEGRRTAWERQQETVARVLGVAHA